MTEVVIKSAGSIKRMRAFDMEMENNGYSVVYETSPIKVGQLYFRYYSKTI